MPERQRGSKSFWEFLKEDDPVIRKLLEIRRKASPEQEYAFGAFATTIYLAFITKAEVVPPAIEQLNTTLRQSFPGYDQGLVLAAVFAAALTVDGATRIAKENLPLYKAWAKYALEDIRSVLPFKTKNNQD